MNIKELTTDLCSQIFIKMDDECCWNVHKQEDKYYPDYQYYCPNYSSTLWTLIFLGDIGCISNFSTLKKPFEIISDRFYDRENRIFTIVRDNFPIPCLNGNMLYLKGYFGFEANNLIDGIIDFFEKFQPFDDGDFKTPSSFPYFSNCSCYGRHSCYW